MTKEEIITTLRGMVKHNEDEDAAIFAAIQALSKPSLPSNLDEAAEKNFETMEVLEHENIFEETHRKIFKAGAEWMAGQGHTVDGTFHHSCGYPSVIELKTYLREYEGADVIVQIRKK